MTSITGRFPALCLKWHTFEHSLASYTDMAEREGEVFGSKSIIIPGEDLMPAQAKGSYFSWF